MTDSLIMVEVELILLNWVNIVGWLVRGFRAIIRCCYLATKQQQQHGVCRQYPAFTQPLVHSPATMQWPPTNQWTTRLHRHHLQPHHR